MAKGPPIEGIKLIVHNMGGIRLSDDLSFPYKLEALFRVPSFMEVAATFIYGREEIIVRGMTKEALEEFVRRNDLENHPRKIKVEITGPHPVPA